MRRRSGQTLAALLCGWTLAAAAQGADLPAEDEWTERDGWTHWRAAPMSAGRIAAERNTGQLVGSLAVGIRVQPSVEPATISLGLGKAWDLSECDQLVFAWRGGAGLAAGECPQITVWAKNEIGEGRSFYTQVLPPANRWRYVRLDLTRPDTADPKHGAVDLRGVFRIDFTFRCAGAQPALVVVDALHFEASERLILERAKRLGPLQGRIRPERYGRYLVPLHAPNSTPELLAGYYAPLTDPPVSPHREWGKPLAGGPIRALVMVGLSMQREVVELAQRLDLDYDLVPLAVVVRYRPEVLEDIARNRYEVVVTAQLADEPQLKPITDWLERQVQRGTGWVAVNSTSAQGGIELAFAGTGYSERNRWVRREGHWITDAVPIEVLPTFDTYKCVATDRAMTTLLAAENRPKMAVFEHGGGRVVNLLSGQGHGIGSLLPSPTLAAHIRVHFDYWEYEYSLLARAIRWAARREGGVSATPTAPLVFDRRAGEQQGGVRVRSETPFEGTVRLRLLATDGTVSLDTAESVAIAAGGARDVPFTLPVGLLGGRHVLDVEVRDRGNTAVEWGAFLCDVNEPVTVTGITLDKEYCRRGEPIRVQALFAIAGGVARDVTLESTIRDTYGRDVYRVSKDVRLTGNDPPSETVELRPDGSVLRTDAYWLRLTVHDELGRAAVAWQRLHVPIPPAVKHQTYWGGSGGTSFHAHAHLRSVIAPILRELGLRVTWAHKLREDYTDLTVENNLWAAPENIIDTGGWNQRFPDGVRTPCLSDPELLDACEAEARTYVARLRKFGIIGYGSEEEMSLNVARPAGTTCLGPHCARELRTWLQAQYGSLAALNAGWDSAFDSWDAVTGLRWEDGGSALKNPARWIDFRTFMEVVYAKPQHRFNRGVRSADPGALSGYNAIAYGINPFFGIDRTRLAQTLSFSIEYQPNQLEDRGVEVPFELLRDSAPAAKISSFVGYTGMENDHDRYWYKAWWMACRQMYAPVYYTLLHEGRPRVTYHYHKIHQTYAYNTFTQLIADSTRPLMRGVGKLLINSRVDDNGIAVYYSQTSMMRHYWEDSTGVTTGALPRWDVRKLLKEAGLHYRRLNVFQLLAGNARAYRVLILPDTIAIGAAEWAATTRFVEAGGTVIAFARTGIADGHGKYVSDPARVESLFGIRYAAEAGRYAAGTARLTGPDAGAGDVPLHLCDPPLTIAGGEVAGADAAGRPVVVRRASGNGQAYYLHGAARLDPSPAAAELLLSLLSTGGVTRRFRLLQGDRDAGGFQCFRYTTDGDDGPEYIALLHNLSSTHEPDTPLALRLAAGGHFYDVLAGGYLGDGGDIAVRVPRRGRPRLYARLPYRAADSLVITCPPELERGRPTPVRIRVPGVGDNAATHILRVTVHDPAGNLVEPVAGNHIAAAGRLDYALDVPYNAPAGEWTLAARDVVTGAAAKVTTHVPPSRD